MLAYTSIVSWKFMWREATARESEGLSSGSEVINTKKDGGGGTTMLAWGVPPTSDGLINHAENNKKYLYDILAIKKETSRP